MLVWRHRLTKREQKQNKDIPGSFVALHSANSFTLSDLLSTHATSLMTLFNRVVVAISIRTQSDHGGGSRVASRKRIFLVRCSRARNIVPYISGSPPLVISLFFANFLSRDCYGMRLTRLSFFCVLLPVLMRAHARQSICYPNVVFFFRIAFFSIYMILDFNRLSGLIGPRETVMKFQLINTERSLSGPTRRRPRSRPKTKLFNRIMRLHRANYDCFHSR